MAKLKGGTVVDGSLYVEGSLKVKAVETTGEGAYLYSNNTLENRLLKSGNSMGQVNASSVSETIDSLGNLEFTVNNLSHKILLSNNLNDVEFKTHPIIKKKDEQGADTDVLDDIKYFEYAASNV